MTRFYDSKNDWQVGVQPITEQEMMRIRARFINGGQPGARITDMMVRAWLENDPPMLAWNELMSRPDVVNWLPWEDKPGKYPRALRDVDDIFLAQFCQANGWELAKKGTAQDAIESVVYSTSYDPLKMYFEDLVWDGVPRVDQLFSRTFGMDDTPHVRSTSRVFMLQAAQRALYAGPECKADVVVVLLGPQGTYKSTFGRCICPVSTWFSDNIPHDLTSKDARAHIGSKFIVEMAEMFSLKKTDTQAFKSFISTTEDTFRPSYGRRDITVPRRCVFLGTTNNPEILGDATGNRRFSILRVEKKGDLGWVIDNRDQLWAEAAVLINEYLREGRAIVDSKIEEELGSDNETYSIDLTNAYDARMKEWEALIGDRFFQWMDALRFMLPQLETQYYNRERRDVTDALRRAGFESVMVNLASKHVSHRARYWTKLRGNGGKFFRKVGEDEIYTEASRVEGTPPKNIEPGAPHEE